MTKKNGRATTETAVRNFLRENPELQLSLFQRVANVSQLAKKITESNGSLNFISVRAALNRIRESTRSFPEKGRADDLLRKSKLTLQDKISVVKSTRPLQIKYISATFLEGSVVYIVDEMIQKIPAVSEDLSVDSHVSMLHILSPKEIETTPGFIMRITHKLFARGINILQLISCSNETILIVSKDQGVEAYETLSGQ